MRNSFFAFLLKKLDIFFRENGTKPRARLLSASKQNPTLDEIRDVSRKKKKKLRITPCFSKREKTTPRAFSANRNNKKKYMLYNVPKKRNRRLKSRARELKKQKKNTIYYKQRSFWRCFVFLIKKMWNYFLSSPISKQALFVRVGSQLIFFFEKNWV